MGRFDRGSRLRLETGELPPQHSFFKGSGPGRVRRDRDLPRAGPPREHAPRRTAAAGQRHAGARRAERARGAAGERRGGRGGARGGWKKLLHAAGYNLSPTNKHTHTHAHAHTHTHTHTHTRARARVFCIGHARTTQEATSVTFEPEVCPFPDCVLEVVTYPPRTSGSGGFEPYTPHPAPCTLHPAPHTLHPAPCTLHPAPCTLHPTPHNPHPTP